MGFREVWIVFESYKQFRNRSFGEILDLNRGAGLGFDALRLGLALFIMLSHVSGLLGHGGLKTEILNAIFGIDGETAKAIAATTQGTVTNSGAPKGLKGLGRPITLALVPMFFALSGFLVSGSAFRTTELRRFLGLRALRILPALIVEVVLSALILGPFFTTVSLDLYFKSPLFWSYWLNILGEPHYYLPGVFEGTSTGNKVNSNLWTLPFELGSYALMSVLILTGLMRNRRAFALLFLIATAILIIANMAFGFQVVEAHLPGEVAVYYFAVGVGFYLFRYDIKFSEIWAIGAAAFAYFLMMFTNTVYLYPLLLTYITIFIGLFPFPQFKLLKSGDYSYGVYLYGYPVTQAIIAGFPAIKGSVLATSLSAIGITCLFAAFSWHAVEKHCLKLKKYISPKSNALTTSLHPDMATQNAMGSVTPAAVDRPIEALPRN